MRSSRAVTLLFTALAFAGTAYAADSKPPPQTTQSQAQRDAQIDNMKTTPKVIREREKEKEHQNDELNQEMDKKTTY